MGKLLPVGHMQSVELFNPARRTRLYYIFKLNGIILSIYYIIDFKAAFDTVSREALWVMLNVFGIHRSISEILRQLLV